MHTLNLNSRSHETKPMSCNVENLRVKLEYLRIALEEHAKLLVYYLYLKDDLELYVKAQAYLAEQGMRLVRPEIESNYQTPKRMKDFFATHREVGVLAHYLRFKANTELLQKMYESKNAGAPLSNVQKEALKAYELFRLRVDKAHINLKEKETLKRDLTQIYYIFASKHSCDLLRGLFYVKTYELNGIKAQLREVQEIFGDLLYKGVEAIKKTWGVEFGEQLSHLIPPVTFSREELVEAANSGLWCVLRVSHNGKGTPFTVEELLNQWMYNKEMVTRQHTTHSKLSNDFWRLPKKCRTDPIKTTWALVPNSSVVNVFHTSQRLMEAQQRHSPIDVCRTLCAGLRVNYHDLGLPSHYQVVVDVLLKKQKQEPSGLWGVDAVFEMNTPTAKSDIAFLFDCDLVKYFVYSTAEYFYDLFTLGQFVPVFDVLSLPEDRSLWTRENDRLRAGIYIQRIRRLKRHAQGAYSCLRFDAHMLHMTNRPVTNRPFKESLEQGLPADFDTFLVRTF